jgi:ribosomal protein L29
MAPDSLMVDIEGIHVGPTRNFTWYMQEALEGSVPTWTRPYCRPLIMHHNEKDGKIIGRIKFVTYTDKNTLSNTGALLFTANVPDKDGKEQIQDGRLKTVSIGCIVHDARCSICGANIAEMSQEEVEQHEHQRGGKYIVNGVEKTCYWLIYKMEAKELSYVIVPSDIYAQNVRIYKPSKKEMSIAANLDNKGVLNLSEATNVNEKDVKEGAVIDENGENKPATPAAAPEVDVEALKKELEDLKVANGDLKGQVDALQKDNDGLKETNGNIAKELDDTRVLLDQAQKSLKTAKDQLTTKEAALDQEKTLRENLENDVIKYNADIREGLIDNITILRKSLNKPAVVKEDLEKRTDESLKDAIKDLKEELANPVDVNNISTASNPAFIETKEPGKKDVKEDKKAGNIDLKEGLEQVFNTIVGSKSKVNI